MIQTLRDLLNPNPILGEVAEYCPVCRTVHPMIVRARGNLFRDPVVPPLDRRHTLHTVECPACSRVFATDATRYIDLVAPRRFDFVEVANKTNPGAAEAIAEGRVALDNIAESWPIDPGGAHRMLLRDISLSYMQIVRRTRPLWLKVLLWAIVAFAAGGIICASACIVLGHLNPCLVIAAGGLSIAVLLSLFAVLEHELLAPRRVRDHAAQMLTSPGASPDAIDGAAHWLLDFAYPMAEPIARRL